MNENEQIPIKEKDYKLNIFILQIISCALILIFALFLRFFGGDLYKKLSNTFKKEISEKTSVSQVLDNKKDDNDRVEKNEEKIDSEETEDVELEIEENELLRIVPVNASVANKNANSLIWPINNGTITSRFGDREDPFFGNSEYHQGLDIAVPIGTNIKSVFDGVIKSTGNSESYGYYIIIKHSDNFETLYAHCSVICGRIGEKVSQGTVIAKSGNSGRSTGPHLHFETKINGKRVNPLEYLTEI